jgi:hypothetical protein
MVIVRDKKNSIFKIFKMAVFNFLMFIIIMEQKLNKIISTVKTV